MLDNKQTSGTNKNVLIKDFLNLIILIHGYLTLVMFNNLTKIMLNKSLSSR